MPRSSSNGKCLQGVESNRGADGNDINDEADRRCDQDSVDRDA